MIGDLDLPEAVREFLAGYVRRRAPAYLVIGEGGRVREVGGSRARYGDVELVQVGDDVAERVPVLSGLLPLGDASIHLPCVVDDRGASFELNAFAHDGDDWVVLLEAGFEEAMESRAQQAEHELALLKREAPGVWRLDDLDDDDDDDAPTLDATDPLAALMLSLGVAVLIPVPGGHFDICGCVPPWLREALPRGIGSRGLDLAGQFLFLENFLIDARALWQRGGDERLPSGPWTEVDDQDREHHLEAWAVSAGGRPFLLLESGADHEEERQLLIQKGREVKLRRRDDLVEHRRAEEELRRERDEADAATRAKSQFLAGMSHELRTPLNSVIGFANVLRKNKAGNLRDQDLLFLRKILDNGTHLLGLINDILDLSKIEAGRMEIERHPVDVADLIEKTIGQLEGQRRDDVALRAELPEDVTPVMTDPRRLKQVLINLVGNALKFTESGSVTVRLIAEDETREALRIDVADTGLGIPEDRQRIVFEAFQQADVSTNARFGGTGLGLAITLALTELLGYEMALASTPGTGSTFSIVLDPRGQPRGARDIRR